MKRPRLPKLENLSEDTQRFFDVLNKESDLAVALISASYLDVSLAGMLKRRMRKSSVADSLLNPSSGALGSMASRADAAYCLELIDKRLYKDLRLVAEIRNLFAHHHFIRSFEDPDVADLVHGLEYLEMMRTSSTGEPLTVLEHASHPRSRFVLDVVLMSQRVLVSGLSLVPCNT